MKYVWGIVSALAFGFASVAKKDALKGLLIYLGVACFGAFLDSILGG